MYKSKSLLVAMALALLLVTNVHAHAQKPGLYSDTRIYKELNTYEFTLSNKNDFTSSYKIYTGDWDVELGIMINERWIGSIVDMKPLEEVSFSIELRISPASYRERLMCTELDVEGMSTVSRVCSKVIMKRN